MVVSMDRWRGQIAVVTGASSGIGAAVAKRLVQEGLQVVGLARRVERVQELADKLSEEKGKLYAIKADVSKPEDVIDAFKWIEENLGTVHILINNAGVSSDTDLIDGDIEKWKTVLDTNVLGLCVATREAINSMNKAGIAGHIIHINSLAGHGVVPFPKFSMYFASKHAVTALTETLRNELNQQKSKIKVTSISPGLVNTEFFEVNKVVMHESIKDFLTAQGQTPEDLADHVIYALSTPPHVQIHELMVRCIGEPF